MFEIFNTETNTFGNTFETIGSNHLTTVFAQIININEIKCNINKAFKICFYSIIYKMINVFLPKIIKRHFNYLQWKIKRFDF